MTIPFKSEAWARRNAARTAARLDKEEPSQQRRAFAMVGTRFTIGSTAFRIASYHKKSRQFVTITDNYSHPNPEATRGYHAFDDLLADIASGLIKVQERKG